MYSGQGNWIVSTMKPDHFTITCPNEEKSGKSINEHRFQFLNTSCKPIQSEIETTLEIVNKPINGVGYISEFRTIKYMKDFWHKKSVSRLTKLNPVTMYDFTELDSKVHKYEVDV